MFDAFFLQFSKRSERVRRNFSSVSSVPAESRYARTLWNILSTPLFKSTVTEFNVDWISVLIPLKRNKGKSELLSVKNLEST